MLKLFLKQDVDAVFGMSELLGMWSQAKTGDKEMTEFVRSQTISLWYWGGGPQFNPCESKQEGSRKSHVQSLPST